MAAETNLTPAGKASHPATLPEHNHPVVVKGASMRLLSPHRVNPRGVVPTSRRSIALRRSVSRILADSPESQFLRQSQSIRQRVRESVRLRE